MYYTFNSLERTKRFEEGFSSEIHVQINEIISRLFIICCYHAQLL
jgi:hypothetical protein